MNQFLEVVDSIKISQRVNISFAQQAMCLSLHKLLERIKTPLGTTKLFRNLKLPFWTVINTNICDSAEVSQSFNQRWTGAQMKKKKPQWVSVVGHTFESMPLLPWNTAQQWNTPSPCYRGSPDVWPIFFILPCKCALALFCVTRFTLSEHSETPIMLLQWLWLHRLTIYL